MSTSPAPVAASVDRVGLSVLSSTRTLAEPARGGLWTPTVAAAGVPVHFHPLPGGFWLVLLRRRWYDATVGTHGPNSYSAHTEDDLPSWLRVHPVTGVAGSVGGLRLVTDKSYTTWTLNGAASRGEFFFTASTMGNGQSQGLVSDFHASKYGSVALVGEEYTANVALDGGHVVVFDRGVAVADPWLFAFGHDTTSGEVYLSRKPWSRVGYAGQPWEYLGERGWTLRQDSLSPVTVAGGAPLVTSGPISVSAYRQRSFLSAVSRDGDDYRAAVYCSVSMERGWSEVDSIPLGSSADYLGGTAYLQGHLGAATVAAAGSAAGIPWVSSVGQVLGGDSAIDTSWGIVGVGPLR